MSQYGERSDKLAEISARAQEYCKSEDAARHGAYEAWRELEQLWDDVYDYKERITQLESEVVELRERVKS